MSQNKLIALENALDGLSSSKVKDRQTAVDQLKSLLDDTNIIHELDNNQKVQMKYKAPKGSPKSTAWNDVFNIVQLQFIDTITGKPKTTGADKKMNKAQPLCDLLKAIFLKANRDPDLPLLDGKLTVSCLVSCLSHEQLPEQLVGTFLNILQSFLESRYLAYSVDTEKWRGLIRSIKDLVNKKGLPPYARILHSIMVKLIQHCSDIPDLLHILRRKLVDLYAQLVQSTHSTDIDANMLEPLVELHKALAVEARGILCAAGEVFIPSVINVLHSSKERSNEREKVYELFLLQMKLHMPHDCTFSNGETFHASSEQKWKELVVDISKICKDEIENISKDFSRSKTWCSGVKLSDNLLQLAVKCVYVMAANVDSSVNDECPPAKRARDDLGVMKNLVEEVCSMPIDLNMMIWLKVLTTAFRTYPLMIPSGDQINQLITLGSTLVQKYSTCPDVTEFLRALILAERLRREDLLKSPMIKSWNSVWDTLTKFISPSEMSSSCLRLMQDIMCNYRPTRVDALFQMYTSHVMPYNRQSLELLEEFLKICNLPSPDTCPAGVYASSCPRLSLLKWLLPHGSLDISESASVITSRVVFSLLMNNPSLALNVLIPHDSAGSTRRDTNFEDILVETSFSRDSDSKPYLPKADIISTVGSLANDLYCFSEILVPFQDMLSSDANDLPNVGYSESKFLKRLTHVIFRLELYTRILHYFSYCKKGLSPEFPQSLVKTYVLVSGKYVPELSKFMKEKRELDGIYLSLCQMNQLLTNDNVPEDIKVVLIPGNSDLVQQMMDFVTNEDFSDVDENSSSIVLNCCIGASNQQQQTFTARELKLMIRQKCAEVLVRFSLSAGDRYLVQKILRTLNEPGFADLSLSFFDLSINFLLLIAPAVRVLEEEDHSSVIGVLQNLCRRFCYNRWCAMRLWNVIEALAPHFANLNLSPDSKFVLLIRGLHKILNSHGIQCSLAYFKVVEVLAPLDTGLNWAWFKDKDSQEPKYFTMELHEFFYPRPSCQVLKLAAVNAMCSVVRHIQWSRLFDFEDTYRNISTLSDDDKSRSHFLRKWLSKLQDALSGSFLIQSDLNQFEVSEEGINRTSSVLMCLSKLSAASPYAELRMMYMMLELVVAKNISPVLARRALEIQLPNSTQLYIMYKPWMIHTWLSDKHIQQLPHELFGTTREDFLQDIAKDAIVAMVSQNKLNELDDLAAGCKMTKQDLVKKHYCSILAGVVAEVLKRLVKPGDEERLNDISDFSADVAALRPLKSIMGNQDSIRKYLLANLAHLLVEMLAYLYNAKIYNRWITTTEKVLRLPSLVHYPLNDAVLYRAVHLLSQEAGLRGKENGIMHTLIKMCPGGVYEAIIVMSRAVHEAHTFYQRIWKLHHFVFFLCLVEDSVKGSVEDSWKFLQGYYCHAVVHAYIRFLAIEDSNDKDNDFLQCVIYNFHKFCTFMVEKDVEESKAFLKIIVQALMPLSDTPDLKEPIHRMLRELLQDNEEKLRTSIEKLDPFPEDSDFRDVCMSDEHQRKDFQTKLKHAVEGIKTTRFACNKERLASLRKILVDHKAELKLLVGSMDGMRFKEECHGHLLYETIKALVKLIYAVDSGERSMEAVRCLGEIGPVDLSVMVLPSWRNHYIMNDFASAISDVVELVKAFLEDENPKVVHEAGRVLRELLRISSNNIMNSKPLLNKSKKGLLLPFMPSDKDETYDDPISVSVQSLQGKLVRNRYDTSFDEWVKNTTVALIECTEKGRTFLWMIKPLCQLKPQFCENILPLVVFSALSCGNAKKLRDKLGVYFNTLIEDFVASEASDSDAGNLLCMNKHVLTVLIRCVEFLRCHSRPIEFRKRDQIPSPWEDNFWLPVNYLSLAKAAQHCGAYLTSILYLDLHSETFRKDGPKNAENVEMNGSEEQASPENKMDPLKQQKAELHKLLLLAHTKIGDIDSVQGLGSGNFYEDNDIDSHVEHLQSNFKWQEVLLTLDAHKPDNYYDICTAYVHLGQYNLCWKVLQGMTATSSRRKKELFDIHYECAWRLSKWNWDEKNVQFVENIEAVDSQCLQKHVYASLRNIVQGNNEQFQNCIKRAYDLIAADLRENSLQSSENLYEFLSNAQLVRSIEDWRGAEELMDGSSLNGKWKSQFQIASPDFKYQERIISAVKVLLQEFQNKVSETDPRTEMLCDLLLVLAQKSRECGQFEISQKYVYELAKFPGSQVLKDLENAKLLWTRGSRDIALRLLHKLLNDQDDTNVWYPRMKLLYAEWRTEDGSPPTVVLPSIIVKALELYCPENGFDKFDTRMLSNNFSVDEIAEAHHTAAEFCFRVYQQIIDRIESSAFRDKKNVFEKTRAQIRSGFPNGSKAVWMQKKVQQDTIEINVISKEKDFFQQSALKYYLISLKLCDRDDLMIFRVITLWLTKMETDSSDHFKDYSELDKEMRNCPLPPHKYISVLHQISARLADNKGKTLEILEDIMIQCAQKHPYHALPVLITQSKYEGVQARNNGESLQTCAKKVLQSLKRTKSNGKTDDLCRHMESLWTALNDLAYVRHAREESHAGAIHNIASLKLLKYPPDKTHIPSVRIEVNKEGYYGNVVLIKRFEKTYALVGGVNQPKKLKCLGSDGRVYTVLLKGNDDMRQDAVMQQCFGVMNKLLEANPVSKKKKLLMRTYNVTPLSERSGVIEWCDGTLTFSEYLGDAHPKYRPQDYTPNKCRNNLRMIQDDRKSTGPYRMRAYLDILDNFKPVFRHFFFEKFKDPGTYVERRLAYTRSVSTSSIVGYILGLGDRHPQNLLIDKTTAEVIHIDLGIAFEQGRFLPTPEVVPFRLTRDMVDGMGYCGIEGVFRNSCENTLEVLRNSSDIILTVLQVLLYDPLYQWKLSEERKQKAQPGAKATANADNVAEEELSQNNSAARELVRLRCKLSGVAEGKYFQAPLSVNAHVSQVINMAISEQNLGVLFHGWQAYL